MKTREIRRTPSIIFAAIFSLIMLSASAWAQCPGPDCGYVPPPSGSECPGGDCSGGWAETGITEWVGVDWDTSNGPSNVWLGAGSCMEGWTSAGAAANGISRAQVEGIHDWSAVKATSDGNGAIETQGAVRGFLDSNAENGGVEGGVFMVNNAVEGDVSITPYSNGVSMDGNLTTGTAAMVCATPGTTGSVESHTFSQIRSGYAADGVSVSSELTNATDVVVNANIPAP